MINDVLLSGGIGVMLALMLSVPAIVREVSRHRHSGHPLLVDIHTFGGRKLSDRESFSLGILFNLGLGVFFGALYPLRPELWSFAGGPYTFWSVACYGVAWYVVAMAVVMPAVGMGVCGRREDGWVWVETLATMVLMVIGYVIVTHWFQPSWFA